MFLFFNTQTRFMPTDISRVFALGYFFCPEISGLDGATSHIKATKP